MKVSSTVLKTSTPGDRRTEFIALAYPKAVLDPRSRRGSVGPGCFGRPLAGAARAVSVSTLLSFGAQDSGQSDMGASPS